MKRIRKIFISFMCILPCMLMFSACGSSPGVSLIDNSIRVTSSNLNGGEWNAERFEGDGSNRSVFMSGGESEKDYDWNAYSFLNQGYSSEEGYRPLPTENDILGPFVNSRDESAGRKVFGGWYLDKDCTVGNCLTSYTYMEKRREVGTKAIDVYPRWLNPGEREIVFEVDGVDAEFKGKSNVKQMRFTLTTEDYATSVALENKIALFPDGKDVQVNKMESDEKEIFAGWGTYFNGMIYDYAGKEFVGRPWNRLPVDEYLNYSFSYENFFKEGVKKPFIVLRPEIEVNSTNLKIVYHHNGGGVWNNSYYNSENLHPEVKVSNGVYYGSGIGGYGALKSDYEYFSFEFANYGEESKRMRFSPEVGHYVVIDFVPNTNELIGNYVNGVDESAGRKVFAGWYLDKECSVGKCLTKTTWDNFLTESEVNGVKIMELNLYAHWIKPEERSLVFENGAGKQERMEFNISSKAETLLTLNEKYSSAYYKVDFNGLVADYSIVKEEGSTEEEKQAYYGKVFPKVPNTLTKQQIEAGQTIEKLRSDFAKEYVNKFTYENFIDNGKLKPFAVLVEMN